MVKIYINSQKYDKVNENYNFKLTIFKNIYRRASLQLDNYIIIFFTILKGLI